MLQEIDLFGNELEAVWATFNKKEFCGKNDLFFGYDYLYAITFSYDLKFITKISSYFKKADLILGCYQKVESDFELAEVMASQRENLEFIGKTCKSLIERVKKDEITFRIADVFRSHEKIYILTNEDSSKTRIIVGSANFTRKGWSGDQRETYIVFDNDDNAFNFYMDEFEQMCEFSSDSNVKKTVIAISEGNDFSSEMLPIVSEEKISKEGFIVESSSDEIDFVTELGLKNHRKLFEQYKKVVPVPSKSGGKKLYKPENIREIKKQLKEQEKAEKEKRKEFPQFAVDFEEEKFYLNGNEHCLVPEKEKIAEDIENLIKYFDGFQKLILPENQRKVYILNLHYYFQIMNFMFLTPFMGKVKTAAVQKGYSAYFFPMFAIINGKKNGGKTKFPEMVQSLMFGKVIGKYGGSDFVKTKIIGECCLNSYGVSLIIDDIQKTRWQANSDEIIKDTSNFTTEEKFPTFILTSNDIDTIKPEICKRVFHAIIDFTLDDVTAAKGEKYLKYIIKNFNGAFYAEYCNRMVKAVKTMIDEMDQQNPESQWEPDIFLLSQKVIASIFTDVQIPLPEYMQKASFSDYFKETIQTKKLREKYLHHLSVNKIQYDRKTNQIYYDASEHYLATRDRDALPDYVKPQIVASFVYIPIKEFETFIGRKVKKSVFSGSKIQ